MDQYRVFYFTIILLLAWIIVSCMYGYVMMDDVRILQNRTTELERRVSAYDDFLHYGKEPGHE